MDKHDKYQLAKANTLANWSFVGLIVPLIGWILAAISSSTLKRLRYLGNMTTTLEERIREVRIKLRWSVWLSLLVIALWTTLSVWATEQHNSNSAIQLQAAQKSCLASASQQNRTYIDNNKEQYAQDYNNCLQQYLDLAQ